MHLNLPESHLRSEHEVEAEEEERKTAHYIHYFGFTFCQFGRCRKAQENEMK